LFDIRGNPFKLFQSYLKNRYQNSRVKFKFITSEMWRATRILFRPAVIPFRFWSHHLKCQSKLNRPGKAVQFSIGSQASSPISEAITASNIKNILF